MIEIGKLVAAALDDVERLTGYIETVEIRLLIRLEGDAELCDAQQPSHRILGKARSGAEVLIGNAWLKTAKHGQRIGERFFSITIDYPGLSGGPINVAAFLDPNRRDWIIVWRRRGAQTATETAA